MCTKVQITFMEAWTRAQEWWSLCQAGKDLSRPYVFWLPFGVLWSLHSDALTSLMFLWYVKKYILTGFKMPRVKTNTKHISYTIKRSIGSCLVNIHLTHFGLRWVPMMQEKKFWFNRDKQEPTLHAFLWTRVTSGDFYFHFKNLALKTHS